MFWPRHLPPPCPCARDGRDDDGSRPRPPVVGVKLADTRAALRDLWVGHVFWVRNVVVSTFAGDQPAATSAERQVVANAKRIAAAIEPFYGKAASEKLFGLLAGHYGAVKQYLEATVARSKDKQDAAFMSLSANATRSPGSSAGPTRTCRSTR